MDGVGCSRARALAGLAALAAVTLSLVPTGASAQQKKLKVKVETNSQTQALNQGALNVSFKAKGLDSVKAIAKATPSGAGQLNFAQKATRQNPRQGTLSLRLTGAGRAALADCASLRVRVEAKGKPKKSAKASALLAEDDRACAEPVREFDTETAISYPTGIDAGPDGAVWFAHTGASPNSLGRVTTAGAYESIAIPVPEGSPAGSFSGHAINDVVAGPDGGVWVTPSGGGLTGGPSVIRRIDPATDAVTEYPLPGTVGSGSKITAGADGALWMSDQEGELLRITTAGDVSAFPLSDPDFPEIAVHPYGIAAGGDGAVWFTTPDVNSNFGGTVPASVGRLDPSTGETQLFPLQDPVNALGYMAADRAGRLWFTNVSGNSIGRIDPESGQIVEFEIPTPDSKPVGLDFANDGSIWFTEQNADNIGRYDPASGTFTEYPLEHQGSLPFDIVEGPDGKIYFTEMGTGRIGQLDPAKAPTGPPNPTDGSSQPPFGELGRCVPSLCQQQVNTTGSTFQIGDALTQTLPPETLTLTAGISSPELLPPATGPMLEAVPLDVEVGGQQAVTRIGLAGPVLLNSLIPLDVTVPIDLYVSQPGNPEGGCVIGPIVQELAQVNDDEGDMGVFLGFDPTMVANDLLGVDNVTVLNTGTFEDTTFEVPEARGCGPLTEVINTLLSLPSASGENATRLPFAQFVINEGL
jgi:virginiamycin B lyase